MLALGQKVVCVTVNESMIRNLPGKRRTAEGTVVYIHRRHRWFLVEYFVCGVALREGYSFYDVGRVVTVKKRRKKV